MRHTDVERDVERDVGTEFGPEFGAEARLDSRRGKRGAPTRRKPARADSPPARQRKSGAGVQPGQLSADEWRLLADTLPGGGRGDD